MRSSPPSVTVPWFVQRALSTMDIEPAVPAMSIVVVPVVMKSRLPCSSAAAPCALNSPPTVTVAEPPSPALSSVRLFSAVPTGALSCNVALVTVWLLGNTMPARLEPSVVVPPVRPSADSVSAPPALTLAVVLAPLTARLGSVSAPLAVRARLPALTVVGSTVVALPTFNVVLPPVMRSAAPPVGLALPLIARVPLFRSSSAAAAKV
jgi:hypothetical protein